MPVQPPNLPSGQFGGGIGQLLAMAQQQSGTKGGGIADGEIFKAFEVIMNKFFPKPEEEDPAISAINSMLGRSPGERRAAGRAGLGSFGFMGQ